MQSKKIAVTGGIGSGKTTVIKILEKMGYPVFSCDEISRGLWQEESYLKVLAEAFPMCTENGRIVKSKLTALVFSDEKERKRLESIAHPRIMRELLDGMEGKPICFAEVPLLFEGGYEDLFDGVILVVRDRAARIAAVMARDGCGRAEVESRIAAQLGHAEKGTVLENNGSVGELEASLTAALKALGV